MMLELEPGLSWRDRSCADVSRGGRGSGIIVIGASVCGGGGILNGLAADTGLPALSMCFMLFGTRPFGGMLFCALLFRAVAF